MSVTGFRDESTKYGQHIEHTFEFVHSRDSDLIHKSLESDKNLVLGIIAECKNGNYCRFHELNDAGIDWVRHYTIVSNKTWADWKKNWKKFNRKTTKAAQES